MPLLANQTTHTGHVWRREAIPQRAVRIDVFASVLNGAMTFVV